MTTSKTPLVLIGAGGHAYSLLDALTGHELRGLLSEDEAQWGKRVLGIEVLGGDDVLDTFNPNEVKLVNAVGSAGKTTARREVFERCKERGFAFAAVTHPSAVCSPHAFIGEGVQLLANSYVGPQARLGNNVLVNTGAVLEHGCHIAAHVHIAPNATLLGGVHIGAGSHIGAGATVLQGVAIGERCVIGAGAVVLHSVETGQTVVGVPAAPIQQ